MQEDKAWCLDKCPSEGCPPEGNGFKGPLGVLACKRNLIPCRKYIHCQWTLNVFIGIAYISKNQVKVKLIQLLSTIPVKYNVPWFRGLRDCLFFLSLGGKKKNSVFIFYCCQATILESNLLEISSAALMFVHACCIFVQMEVITTYKLKLTPGIQKQHKIVLQKMSFPSNCSVCYPRYSPWGAPGYVWKMFVCPPVVWLSGRQCTVRCKIPGPWAFW